MLIGTLKRELQDRCGKNPQYSLRAFARSLKIDASILSALLRGKRQLTVKVANQLLASLDMNVAEKRRILLETFHPEVAQSTDQGFETISEDQFELISGWEHFAICSLMETRGFRSDVAWIGKSLGIPMSQATEAMARLERVGLVKRFKGKWIPTGKRVTIGNDVPNTSLRKAHREYIERALHSLDFHGVGERDITGITMAISAAKLPEAKKRITEFRRSLCEFLEEGNKDEVYRLNVQLFPVRRKT